eukprot:c47152_g1_i1 orf=92-1438(+)
MSPPIPAIKQPTSLCIKLEEPILIRPVANTPHEALFLSNMDLAVIFPVETVYFYRCGNREACSTTHLVRQMQAALERLLVHYYFMAGRLRWNQEEHRLELDCNNAGMLFAGATSDLKLDEIGDLDHPDPVYTSLVLRLLPSGLTSLNDLPLATLQVTRFKCGGFAVGLSTNHVLFDGISAADFLLNYSAFVRGKQLVITPKPDRRSLRARSPPQIKYDHLEFLKLRPIETFSESNIIQAACYPGEPSDSHVYRMFPVTGKMLAGLKELGQHNCTAFEALTAHVWKCRTTAMDMEPSQPTSVSFAVDCRKSVELDQPLPDGFSGIAVTEAHARLPATEVLTKPLHFLVKEVQEARAKATNPDYVKSVLDFLEVHQATICQPHGFGISAWWRIPFHNVDFGWGKPVHAGPVTCAVVEIVLFLYNGTEDGLNVYLALEPHHMAKFEQLFWI